MLVDAATIQKESSFIRNSRKPIRPQETSPLYGHQYSHFMIVDRESILLDTPRVFVYNLDSVGPPMVGLLNSRYIWFADKGTERRCLALTFETEDDTMTIWQWEVKEKKGGLVPSPSVLKKISIQDNGETSFKYQTASEDFVGWYRGDRSECVVIEFGWNGAETRYSFSGMKTINGMRLDVANRSLIVWTDISISRIPFENAEKKTFRVKDLLNGAGLTEFDIGR